MARFHDMNPWSPPSLRTWSTPGSQVEMIGIAQQNLDAEFFQQILRNAFDAGKRAHRHEDWGFDFSVGSEQAAFAGRARSGVNLELQGHCVDCSNRTGPLNSTNSIKRKGESHRAAPRRRGRAAPLLADFPSAKERMRECKPPTSRQRQLPHPLPRSRKDRIAHRRSKRRQAGLTHTRRRRQLPRCRHWSCRVRLSSAPRDNRESSTARLRHLWRRHTNQTRVHQLAAPFELICVWLRD